MKKIKENRFLIILVLIGVIIFGFVANKLMVSNKKVTAVVPARTIEASTVITSDMLKEVEVSADTPGNFIRNPSTVIGSRMKNTVYENQLLYESDFMSSWSDFTESENVPDDYIITSIQVPDERACGGIITAGDYIDVLLVNQDSNNLTELTEDAASTWLNSTNTNANYVLANVLVLSTNSALASNQESDVSVLQDAIGTGSNDDGNLYIVALSYNDYMKFRIANSTKNAEIWLNICPAQNAENDPLIPQMTSQRFAYLHDAQQQVMDENGNMLVEDYYEADENGILIETSPEVSFVAGDEDMGDGIVRRTDQYGNVKYVYVDENGDEIVAPTITELKSMIE